MGETILIIDDEKGMCESLSELLEASGYKCLSSIEPRDTLLILSNNNIDLLITDLRMPGMGGIELLRSVKSQYSDLPVIMITGFSSINNAVTAMKYGALNFFTKPIHFDEMIREIKTLFSSRRKRKHIPSSSGSLLQLSSRNKEMMKIINVVEKVAPTEASVIITGESGTGKELVANYLHHKSLRSNGPFIKVNCAAIPEGLMESELFGHEKGAFTDAKNLRKGKFEMADGGSIFLDEIGDMDINTQAKILRVIQEKEFQRLGGHNIIKCDLRIIAATNKDIPRMIESGEFREDLYYRLSVICIKLLPLRNRIEDLHDLINTFISEFNMLYGKEIKGISGDVKIALESHSWPGNIRELKNCMERSVIFCENELIGMDDLPEQYKCLDSSFNSLDYSKAKDEYDKELIVNALLETNGVKQKAAEKLQIHRKTLYNKMKKLGLE